MAKRQRPESPGEVAERTATHVARQTAQQYIRAEYSGPLPHPSQLEHYEKTYPGAAKIIFDQWQRQTQHRQRLEYETITSQEKRADRGQVMAFIIVMTVTVGGFVLIGLGHSVAGTIASIGGLAGLLTLFFGRRSKTDKELASKAQP